MAIDKALELHYRGYSKPVTVASTKSLVQYSSLLVIAVSCVSTKMMHVDKQNLIYRKCIGVQQDDTPSPSLFSAI